MATAAVQLSQKIIALNKAESKLKANEPVAVPKYICPAERPGGLAELAAKLEKRRLDALQNKFSKYICPAMRAGGIAELNAKVRMREQQPQQHKQQYQQPASSTFRQIAMNYSFGMQPFSFTNIPLIGNSYGWPRMQMHF